MTTNTPPDDGLLTAERVHRIAKIFAAYAIRISTTFRIVVAHYPNGARRGAIQVHRDAVPREKDYLADASGLVVYRHTDAPHGIAPPWVTSFVCGKFTVNVTDDEALATLESELRDAMRRRADELRGHASMLTRNAEAMEHALAIEHEDT